VKVLHACISCLPSRSLAWASDQAGLAGPGPAPVGLSSAQPPIYMLGWI